MTDDTTASIAAIAIGRNEGARLEACLASLAGKVRPLIYVDSGSTDDSLEIARRHGADIVALDMSAPFTAARARNAGFARLQALCGDKPPAFIQFVDGDCALADGWLETASAFLTSRPDIAIACGRRRERHPDASIFNRLCDIEWATPIGEAAACGGDFLVRHGAFAAVHGFNAGLIAGEEPDLCFRLRRAGWLIWRLDAEMTHHDAAMTRLGQWWARAKRAGYAYANGNALNGGPPEHYWRRETLRAVLFGGALPAVSILGALVIHPAVLSGLLYFPVQALRIYARAGHLDQGRAAWALSCAFARLPECQGVVAYWINRLRRRDGTLIEYK